MRSHIGSRLGDLNRDVNHMLILAKLAEPSGQQLQPRAAEG